MQKPLVTIMWALSESPVLWFSVSQSWSCPDWQGTEGLRGWVSKSVCGSSWWWCVCHVWWAAPWAIRGLKIFASLVKGFSWLIENKTWPEGRGPRGLFHLLHRVAWGSPSPKTFNIYFWTFWKASQDTLVKLILILIVKITIVTIVNIQHNSMGESLCNSVRQGYQGFLLINSLNL